MCKRPPFIHWLPLLLLFPLTAPASSNTVVSGSNQQQIKGWGCVPGQADSGHGSQVPPPGYPTTGNDPLYFDEASCPQAIKYLLNDLGISVAKVNLSYDMGNADGSLNNHSYWPDELNLITLLSSHHIPYVITCFGPPLGMKTASVVGSEDANHKPVYLDPGHYNNFYTYWNNMLGSIASAGDSLPLAISFQNEPSYLNTVQGAYYDIPTYMSVAGALRSALNAHYPSVLMMGPDDGHYDSNGTLPYRGSSTAFLGGSNFSYLGSYPSFNAAVGIFASHSYNQTVSPGNQTPSTWLSGCNLWNDGLHGALRDCWMTEFCSQDFTGSGTGANPDLTDITLASVRTLMSDVGYMRNNVWMWLQGWRKDQYLSYGNVLLEGDTSQNGYLGNNYDRSPLFYVLRKIFRSAPPGSFARSVHCDDTTNFVTASATGSYATNINMVDMLAFVNGTNMTVVMANNNPAAQSTVLSGLTGQQANVYQMALTGAVLNEDMQLITATDVSGGQLSSGAVTLPAKSITIVVTGPANLLTNAGFEDGPWPGAWGTTGLVSAPDPNDEIFEGRAAASITGPSSGVNQTLNGGFTVGGTYNLSCAGCLSVADSGGAGAYVGAYCYDSNKNLIEKFGVNFNTETAFTEKDVNFTIPLNTKYVIVQGEHFGSNNTFYLDDVAFTARTNLLSDGDFESGLWGGNSGSVTLVNPPLTHTGNHAASIPDGAFLNQTISTGFAAGETLTLSAWGCTSGTDTGGAGGLVFALCLDSSGAQTGRFNLPALFQSTLWTEYTTNFVVPAHTFKIQVQAEHFQSANTLYLDDVELYQPGN